MAFPWKIREISGNWSISSGNFRKQKNLREFSGNFWLWQKKMLFLRILQSFSYVFPSVFKPPCMETYIYFQNKKITKFSFKITCDAHGIVSLAIQSNLRVLASLAYPQPTLAPTGIVVGHCVRPSSHLSVSVQPEWCYHSNFLIISAISLKFGGMM